MKENFKYSLALVLKSEGGWSDHPSDPGGATMKGVTVAVYAQFMRRPVTKDELRNIPVDHIEQIYQNGYWNPSHCDALASGVDYEVFDFAANAGVGRAAKTLQAALGVQQDGAIGPITLAVAATADPARLIRNFSEAKMRFYRSLNTFPTFGAGWANRVRHVEDEAMKMLMPDFSDVKSGIA